MSDLQFALLAIGTLVVASVCVFNWWQERQFQRRVGQSFQIKHDDVLLRESELAEPQDGETRIEPTLSAEPVDFDALPPAHETPARQEPLVSAPIEAVADDPAGDTGDGESEIDYCAHLKARERVASARLRDALQRLEGFDKPVTCSVFDEAAAEWRELDSTPPERFRKARLALQLVDRAGPVMPESLARFRACANEVAHALSADIECPEVDRALLQALELDKFCIEADIAVGLNIVAHEGARFPGTKIRALAEAAGFRLDESGVFRFGNEHRQDLFTLDNQEPAPFLPEQIKSMSTRGVTLVFDVPKAAEGLRAFDRMVEFGRSFAAALGGDLVDDNKVALAGPAIEKIRAQLRAVYAKMDARGIAPGSARARRLFS